MSLLFVSSSLSLVHEFRFLITAGLIGSRGAVSMWLDVWFKELFCKTEILIRALYLCAEFFSRRASMDRILIATRVQSNQNELSFRRISVGFHHISRGISQYFPCFSRFTGRPCFRTCTRCIVGNWSLCVVSVWLFSYRSDSGKT